MRVAGLVTQALSSPSQMEVRALMWEIASTAMTREPWALVRLGPGSQSCSLQAGGRLEGVPLRHEDVVTLRKGVTPERLGATARYPALPLVGRTDEAWGFWCVAPDIQERARNLLPDLEALVRHAEHLEEHDRLREVNLDLSSILNLGNALANAGDPSEMASTAERVIRQVLRSDAVCLVVFLPSETRLFLSLSPGDMESYAVAREAWLSLLASNPGRWEASHPIALEAGTLLGLPPSSGIAEALVTSEEPVALLLAFGRDAPFSVRDQSLLARIADFIHLNFIRWTQLEVERRKTREIEVVLGQLGQEKDRLDLILRCVPVGLLLVSREGDIFMANDAAQHALGLTTVELRESRIFSGRQAGKAILGLIQKASESSGLISTPYEMEGRWYQVQVAPLPGQDQYLFVTEDIQDWFQMGRLKEDLISIISHEVKNPLAAISNAADLLMNERTGTLGPTQKRLASLVSENSRSIVALLEDVVRLSRVHHMGGSTAPVDLKALLREILESLADTAQGKQIHIAEDIQAVTLPGDARMLKNLFTNLIGNAIKYTGFGGHVGVRLWAVPGTLRLRVVDDGPGIPPAELDRVFQPFFRGSNMRDKVPGTGLGLVIAKNVAERMGGKLSAQSPIGDADRAFAGGDDPALPGTVFELEIPLR